MRTHGGWEIKTTPPHVSPLVSEDDDLPPPSKFLFFLVRIVFFCGALKAHELAPFSPRERDERERERERDAPTITKKKPQLTIPQAVESNKRIFPFVTGNAIFCRAK